MHATTAMAALHEGPDELVENLERHADLIDLPCIGTDDNFAFPNMQLNIAPASAVGSGILDLFFIWNIFMLNIHADNSLTSWLGFFGRDHIDVGDHKGTFSCAGVYSSLSPNCDPGYFFLLDIMVCIRLDPGVEICFSRLQPHGGTGAICVRGQPKPYDYRLIVVGYPVHDLIEGSNVLPFATLPRSLPHQRELSFSPEWTPNK